MNLHYICFALLLSSVWACADSNHETDLEQVYVLEGTDWNLKGWNYLKEGVIFDEMPWDDPYVHRYEVDSVGVYISSALENATDILREEKSYYVQKANQLIIQYLGGYADTCRVVVHGDTLSLYCPPDSLDRVRKGADEVEYYFVKMNHYKQLTLADSLANWLTQYSYTLRSYDGTRLDTLTFDTSKNMLVNGYFQDTKADNWRISKFDQELYLSFRVEWPSVEGEYGTEKSSLEGQVASITPDSIVMYNVRSNKRRVLHRLDQLIPFPTAEQMEEFLWEQRRRDAYVELERRQRRKRERE